MLPAPAPEVAPAAAHPATALHSPAHPSPAPLDEAGPLHGRVWRGSSLGTALAPTLPSGFTALDAELPGGGWPLHAVTELLAPQAGVLEWRLLAPALRGWWAAQALPAATPGRRLRTSGPAPRALLLVNPPHTPHLPGLQALGLPPQALIWASTATPAEALWAAEQAIKSRVALLAWLPDARPEQLRRLQVHALGSDAPTFLVRPERAGQQSSAAPLRVAVRPGDDWGLDVHLLKRRGPMHEGWLQLPALPAAVAPLLTAAKRKPRPTPVPLPAPFPTPASPPTERADALARPVLQA
ncbi:translesion DNA synthesis-associated protein ImuA [Roseateles sp. BYS96W]|uniref:Translesion DNA synthesis-associated protein ImuA n=1 Tax=Pelomonas nitida TaxID=3299027 RepID=A0ABW7G097_9BURK